MCLVGKNITGFGFLLLFISVSFQWLMEQQSLIYMIWTFIPNTDMEKIICVIAQHRVVRHVFIFLHYRRKLFFKALLQA